MLYLICSQSSMLRQRSGLGFIIVSDEYEHNFIKSLQYPCVNILPFCLRTVEVKGRERVGGAGSEGGSRWQRELGLEPWFADSFKNFSYVYLLCLCVCMYVQMYSNAICHSLCVEIRGQTTCGNLFSCPTFWSWEWNAGCQAWRRVLYWLNHLASPTCWFLISTLISFKMGWVAWNDDQWRRRTGIS